MKHNEKRGVIKAEKYRKKFTAIYQKKTNVCFQDFGTWKEKISNKTRKKHGILKEVLL